ncbi:MAG: hypothetical protein IJ794_09360 [Lachnospiraceae bacterium]|nr:hypothetical protein [Lachnospiraceae bacterium]
MVESVMVGRARVDSAMTDRTMVDSAMTDSALVGRVDRRCSEVVNRK